MASQTGFSTFDTQPRFVPGRYASDVKVALLFLSGALFLAASASVALDGWEDGMFLIAQAVWAALMYIALASRP